MATGHPAAADLYRRVADLYLTAHTPQGGAQLVALVEASWAGLASREPCPEDAEVCRLVMLTAAQAQDYSAVRLWRARALSRFTAIGWVEGVAAIIMGEAFAELARENHDYTNGRTLDVIRPSAAALGILSEIERFTVGEGTPFVLGPGSPSRPVLRRLFYEKRGFLQLLTGDHDAAGHSYDLALTAAEASPRGRVKVRLGRLLIDYLQLQGREGAEVIATETEALAGEAFRAASPDVSQTADLNAAVMRQRGQQLVPYEIL